MPDFPPVRFGILGAANIARQFTRGLVGSTGAEVVCVGSRDAEKARAFAAECAIPRSHPSYEAVLADPEVEAVYIPLPNDMHAEWAIKAAAAGKHVLSEKPLCLGGAEATAMFAAAKAHDVHLREAYPYMSQPQTLRVRDLLAQGAIGKIQTLSAAFGFSIAHPDGTPKVDPANIRLVPARGGGALLDAGTYAMSFVRLAVGERPTRVHATQRNTTTGVDLTVAATLEFPSGALAQISCTMAASFHRHAVLVGDAGIIETSYANHAPADGRLTLRLKQGIPNTNPFTTETLDGADGFRLEAESFARLVRTGTGWNGATEAESIDIALALAAVAASARSGIWVDLPPA